MEKHAKEIAIIMPLWKHRQYLGRFRVGKFLRWLKAANISTTIICAGDYDQVNEEEYWIEIVLKDFAGIYKEERNSSSIQIKKKKNKLRAFIANLIFLPDRGIVWGWRVYFNEVVREKIKDIDFILISSPPESPAVSAYRLAKKFRKKLVVDLRDGWMDDPLRPELINNKIRSFREKQIEKRVLTFAHKIFVTSNTWKTKLTERYGYLKDKIIVVTNTYPPNHKSFAEQFNKDNNKLVFLYLGRLSASRKTQRIENILYPLLEYSENNDEKFEIRFVGHLVEEDLIGLNKSTKKFPQSTAEVVIRDEVPKLKIVDELKEASGLLLLCISKAAIPSKFFEYIPTLKPILVITPINSAVWNIASKLPQAYLINSESSENNNEVIRKYINHSKGIAGESNIPDVYSEEHMCNIFINELKS